MSGDYSSDHRDALGRRVREVWVRWAERQPNPKPSWLVPYDLLSEADKEADRCIGSALWGDGFEAGMRMQSTLTATLTAPHRQSCAAPAAVRSTPEGDAP